MKHKKEVLQFLNDNYSMINSLMCQEEEDSFNGDVVSIIVKEVEKQIEAENAAKHISYLLRHPDPEMIRKRDAAIASVGKIEYLDDGTSFTVEIKDLDEEFLKRKIKERESETNLN